MSPILNIVIELRYELLASILGTVTQYKKNTVKNRTSWNRVYG